MAEKANLRVLVVDDDPDTAQMISFILRRKLTCSAELAYDCAGARARLSENNFDLVTLDYQLPDGDGLELLAEITGSDNPPPVVMVTGHGDERTAVSSYELGASGYVVKDSRMKAMLTGAVRSALSVAARRRAEEALRVSEANFRAFFESIDDMIVVATPEGMILYANSACRRKLGYEDEELKRMHAAELCREDTREETDREVRSMLRGESDRPTATFVSKNKEEFICEMRAWSGSWNGADCVFGIGKDMSAEMEAEERFERLFRRNPTPMALQSLPGQQFVDVNDAFLATLGFTRGEVIGNTPAELELFILPEQQELAAEKLQLHGRLSNEELAVLTRSGDVLSGLFSGEVISMQGRRFLLTVMIDITERRIGEDRLRIANEELRAYAHSVSHDLKGPIGNISMAAELLEKAVKDSGDRDSAEALSLLKKNAGNASGRIEALLKLAESAREPADVERVDINKLVEEIIEEFSARIEERGVKVTVGEELGSVLAGREQVRLIFSNLISNALKHNDSDSPEVSISCLGTGHDCAHRYLVRDNGPGIPPEDIGRVFVPFYRGDRTGETGIGLSIAQMTAGVYGGVIRVYNDNGACFEVTLKDYEG